MEERRLSVFAAVARAQSFSRAAETMHLSQPAVSQQVAALEAELGVRLLERSRRRVRLTAAGTALLAHAESLLRGMAETRRSVAAAAAAIGGGLAIGASLTVGEYVLPAVLARFGRLHPHVRLRSEVDNSTQVVRRLMDGALDVGFIEGDLAVPGVVLRPFRRDELVVVAPADHRFAEAAEVPLDELLQEPFVLREPGSGTRQVMERRLQAAGVDAGNLRVVLEQTGTEAIKAAVEAGLGVSVLSRAAVAKELLLHTLVARPVRGVPMVRDMSEVQLTGRTLIPAARELVKLLRGDADA